MRRTARVDAATLRAMDLREPPDTLAATLTAYSLVLFAGSFLLHVGSEWRGVLAAAAFTLAFASVLRRRHAKPRYGQILFIGGVWVMALLAFASISPLWGAPISVAGAVWSFASAPRQPPSPKRSRRRRWMVVFGALALGVVWLPGPDWLSIGLAVVCIGVVIALASKDVHDRERARNGPLP
jgi:hypothetical protein